ncbi:sterile alpha motif domain-containing protein 9-like [Diadema setosum]|uniref:sterile alpha motif domain-containing protein 9-like n=1 Tax=Diadema setosum TaxID=31175 RepID=UPI003B39FEF7
MESGNHSCSADAGASGSEAPREMAPIATPTQETKEGDDNTKLSCPFDGEDRHGDGIKKNHMALGNEQCNSPSSSSDSFTAAKKLRYLLTGSETGILDLSYHPILVVNKPESSEEEGSEPSQPLEFVSMANWIAVFDCDPNSQQNGVSSYVKEHRPINTEQLDTFPKTIKGKVLSAPDDVGLISSWIFVNRQEDLKESDRQHASAEWTQLHNRNIDKAITNLIPNNMPKKRVVFLFLLLSADHLFTMAQLFGKLFSFARQGQLAVIVKNRELYEAFATEVGRIRSEAVEELGQRAIVGIDLTDIDCFMQQMISETDKTDNAIRLPSKGQSCHVPGKVRMSWQDLDILSLDECKCNTIKPDSKEFNEFVEKKKLEFYQGCSADWWPFYLTEYHKKDLVLRRKCAEELKETVTGILNASSDGGTGDGVDTVVTIDIFHHRGSGGSTCARQVLWDFHQKLRCVSVRRVVPDTMAAILAVRRYGYSDDEKEANIPPILVLIDKSSDGTIKYLTSEAKKMTKGLGQMVCIFLCCRKTDASMPCGEVGGKNLSICVEHKLTEAESQWFVSKSEQLQKKYHETPEQVIGFVVMKEAGNPHCVEKIVRNILRDTSFREKTLLKYIAVIEKFVHNFCMPVSCCDDLMDDHTDVNLSENQSKYTGFHPWECRLSKAARLLLISTTIHTNKGRTKALELVNSILAPELVKQLADERRESVGTTVWKFTSSVVIQPVSRQCTSNVSHMHIVNEVVRLLSERNYIQQPKLIRRYRFSSLLEYLLENEKIQAYAIVHAVHNYRGGPAPCQTLARMYLSDELYDTALHYAHLTPKNNFDTVGRIIISQLKGYCLDECETPLNSADVEGLLQLFWHGIEAFEKGKDDSVNIENIYDGALTPHYGELELVHSFLNILKVRVEPFCSQESHDPLNTYLTTDADVEGLGDVMKYHRRRLRELQARVTESMDLISGILSSSNDIKGIARTLSFHEINYSKLECYFTLPESDLLANKQRRKKVESIKMCKPTLRAIFNFFTEDDRKSLKVIIRFLSENQPKDIFDLKVLICALFALAAFPDEIVDYGTVEHYAQRLRRLRPPSLYGAFFHVMLLWPRTNQTTMKQSLPQAIKALEDAKNLTNQNENHVVLKPRFFLTRRRGLRAFIHRSALGLVDSGNSLDVESVTECLQSEQLRGVLARQEGTLEDNSLKYSIPTGEEITIKLSSPYRVATRRAKVTFILGFSYAGPVAYDVHER